MKHGVYNIKWRHMIAYFDVTLDAGAPRRAALCRCAITWPLHMMTVIQSLAIFNQSKVHAAGNRRMQDHIQGGPKLQFFHYTLSRCNHFKVNWNGFRQTVQSRNINSRKANRNNLKYVRWWLMTHQKVVQQRDLGVVRLLTTIYGRPV